MICVLVDHEKWPDKTFPCVQVMIGVQLVGEVPPTGLWCPKTYTILAKERTQAIPLSTFHRQHAREAGKIKRIVEKRAAKAAGNKDQEVQIQAVYDASMAEIEAGTASGPFTYSHLEKRFGYGKFRPMMRSVIEKNGKYRAVDNGKEMTKTSIYTQILGRMHPHFPAAVGRLFAEKLADAPFSWKMGGFKDDETAAYKKTATITPQFTPAVFADPQTGKAIAIIPHGVNFGHGFAGRGYSRKPCFIN